MKSTSVLIAMLLLLVGVATPLRAAEPGEEMAVSQAAEPTLPVYTSSEGRFAIQFPGQPEPRTRTVPIIDQTYDWTILRLQDGSGFYGVAYTDLTSDTIEWGANPLIDSIKNTLTDELNWSALEGYGRSIDVDGYPAREIIGTQNNQLSILRLVLADQRLYAIMSSSENLEEIGQFLDSFQVQPWQPYVSEAGGFSVRLPLPPSDEVETIDLGGAEFEWNVIEGRNFTAPDDSYTVGYADVSTQDLQDGADALLNRVGTNLIERWRATNVVESGKAIALGDHPGRSFIGTTNDGEIIAVRFFLVGQRMYAVGAISDDVTNITQFLDSFALR